MSGKVLKAISIAVCLSVFLCGCSLNIVPVSHTNEYIITSLGFDCEQEGIKVTVEALIINTEQSSEKTNSKTFSALEKEIPVAIEKISQQATQSLEMSHCAVVVIGESVSQEYMNKICDYFYNTKDITLSTLFIAADNAQKLLSQKAVSSVAMGYDIVSMLENQSRENGVNFKNRFFEIEAALENESKVFALPFFLSDGENFSFEGATIFSNNKNVLKFSGERLFYYAVANDMQGKGKFFLNGKKININSAYTSFKTELKNEKCKITATVTVDTEQNKTKIENNVENGIKELLELSKQTKTDLLEIKNLLYHREKKFLEKNKGFYQNVEYLVKINEK